MNFQTVNPATGEAIHAYERPTAGEIDRALDSLAAGYESWRARTIPERASVLRAAARLLERRSKDLALLMAEEMGKPHDQGRAEVLKCATACGYYADHAQAFLAPEVVDSHDGKRYVASEPLGVILAIMPWNFPVWQVIRFAAPNLAAGNVALLKHADGTAGTALSLEALLHDAGVPDGAFRAVLADHEATAELIRDRRVAAVTLTGSTRAGRAVAAVAGEALKKCVLELGGSDPYVVLADADVEHAARTCVRSRLANTGQSCIAAKRFICVEPLLGEFTERVVTLMEGHAFGDPRADEPPALGPLARHDLRDALHEQVRRSVDAGADVLLGGETPGGPGAFYPPTVLAGVRPGMAAFDEELFGPVAAIVCAEDDDDAIALANRTEYGLGAAVFTRDAARGEEIARTRLQAGSCFVNDFVRSDPALPFGGIRDSGFGRELSHHGMHEFLNRKTVVVKPAG